MLTPSAQEGADGADPRAVDTEQRLVTIEEVVLGDGMAVAVAGAPFDVGQPADRLAEQDCLRCVEQSGATPWLYRNAERRERLNEGRVGGSAADEHGDVAVRNAGIVKIEDHVGDPSGFLGGGVC